MRNIKPNKKKRRASPNFPVGSFKRPLRDMTAELREKCWPDLGKKNDLHLYQAMARLAADAKESVKFLQAKCLAATGIPRPIAVLLADLEAEAKKRDKAAQDLRSLGEFAVLPLRDFASKSLEARRRGEQVLKEVIAAHGEGNVFANPDLIRLHRAITILARTGTPQADDALQNIARQHPQTWAR